MSRPHLRTRLRARRRVSGAAAAFGWGVVAVWAHLMAAGPASGAQQVTSGRDGVLSPPGPTCCPYQWTPYGIFPACNAPVDWSVPRGYRGKLVRQCPGGFPAKLIALTFDDGPDAKVTPRILDALAAHRARATFFVLGCQARHHTDLLRRMTTTGHSVGNHSFSHPAHPSATEAKEELTKTAEIIRQATSRPPACFRPPYGITKNELTPQALREGYAAVLWTVDAGDALGYGTEGIVARATRAPAPGQIILFHDGPGHHGTAQAVPTILEKLSAAGFQFVTIPELLYAWDGWLQRTRSGAHCPEKSAGR